LDVTTVIYNNASYEILKVELERVGVDRAGPRAQDLYDLGRPRLDFASLARGMGVPATRAETAEQFTRQLAEALAEPGPALIDAIVPPLS
jgi:acetolactate synthase I/II/III large subunit